MSGHLDVVAFDDRNQKHPTDSNLPEWLPKHEFLMLIIAPAGSGKTTLLLNIMMRIYPQYWNRIYIFSPTIHNDAKWNHVKEDPHLLQPMQNSSSIDRHESNQDEPQTESTSDTEEWKAPEEYKDMSKMKCNEIVDPFNCFSRDKKSKRKRIGLSKQYYKSVMDKVNYETKDGKKDPIKEACKVESLASKMYRPPLPERLKKEVDVYSTIIKYHDPYKGYDDDEFNPLPKRKQPPPKEQTPPTKQQKVSKSKSGGSNTMIQKDHMFEDYSEQTLSKLMDDIDKDVKDEGEKGEDLVDVIPRTLWVFDDMVGSGLFSSKRNYAFKRLTVRRRHYYSSLIGVTQAYKEIPRTTRTNANCIIFFRIDSDEELLAIYREYPMGLKFNDWMKVVKYCTQEPYSFIMFNLQTSDINMRIVKNFDCPLTLQMQGQIVGHAIE